MTTKVKIAIAAAAALGLGYYVWKKRGGSLTRPVCGDGATWKVESDPTGYSSTVAASIRQWGGYCARQGFVDEPTVADGPVTMPWQLP